MNQSAFQSDRLRAAEVAAGDAAAELVLRGGRIVDVFAGRVRRGDVAIGGGRIARIGDADSIIDESTRVFECSGRFVLPGFIEPHLHIGGTQVTTERLAELLLPRGTVAISMCFREPAAVAGIDAALTLLERAQGTGLDLLLSPFFAAALGSDGRFSFADLERLLLHPACVELREWSYLASRAPIEGMARIHALALEQGRAIGGHLEGLGSELVQASAALGVRSDHEATSVEEALDRIAAGIVVQAREGSGARDLKELVRAITEEGADPRCFSFSTDDQELSSFAQDGHLDARLRLAVSEGVAPIEAVRMATLNAATSLGVELDYGAVAPGRLASLAIVDDLAAFPVSAVFSRGVQCAHEGEYLFAPSHEQYPARFSSTMVVDQPLAPTDFRLELPSGNATVRVIGVREGSLVTEELNEQVDVQDGHLAHAQPGLAKIAVVDRHAGGARRSIGLIRGLGIKRGAVATSVNPGRMNLLVFGADESDMALAANSVVEMQGGIAVAAGGEVVAHVALPLFGILSHAPLAETVERCCAIERAIRAELGSSFSGILTIAGFACLTTSIPVLKIGDHGLVRVSHAGPQPVSLAVQP